MGNKDDKTNVMRLLDEKGIEYGYCGYAACIVNGAGVAAALGQAPEAVFKTLVTVGKTGKNYVFMVPVEKELDLKKAAKAAGEKSLDMLPQKELLPLTGYIHGGCSPIGMKKLFPTFIDASAESCGKIFFSAGKVGRQVSMTLSDLQKMVPAECADIVKE